VIIARTDEARKALMPQVSIEAELENRDLYIVGVNMDQVKESPKD
jgi:hypothetical protein